MRKGEIACYKQFLPFSQCFPQLYIFRTSKCSIVWKLVHSLPNNKFLEWSKLKAFADDKIKVAEKLKFVLDKVENIAGRGENTGYKHFLLFPQCFQEYYFGVVKSRDYVVMSEPFPKQALVFMCLQYRSFENTVGKGEIAHDVKFLLFPQCFQALERTFCHFHQIQNSPLQTLSVWKSLKFVVWERVKYAVVLYYVVRYRAEGGKRGRYLRFHSLNCHLGIQILPQIESHYHTRESGKYSDCLYLLEHHHTVV